MNFRTNDWLKKLNTTPNMAMFPHPVAPTSQKRTAKLTLWMPQSVSNPMQQFTGRVGGIQTTAQRTQPWSAQLGGWFGQSPGQRNMQSMEALMGWLSPYLTQQLSQSLAGVFGKRKPTQGWAPALPQNMTNKLLKWRVSMSRRR